MPDFRLSDTTIAVTPPKNAKVRVCEPIQSARRLRPGRFRIGVAGRAEHGDEQLAAVDHLAGRPVDHLKRRAGVVDEQPLAGDMRLPHGRRQAPLPGAVELAEPAVAVAVGVRRRDAPPTAAAASRPAGAARDGSPPSRAAAADPSPRRAAAGRDAAPAPRRSGPRAAAKLRPARRARRRQSPAAVAPIAEARRDLAFGHAGGRSRSTSRILRMGNLCPGMPRSLPLERRPRPCRFADHPTVPVTPVHSLVAIARNGWSRSIGTTGRNQPVRPVRKVPIPEVRLGRLHSALIFAALMIGHHFSTSAF